MVADAKAIDTGRVSKVFQNPQDDQERRLFVGSFSGHERNVFFLKQGRGFSDLSVAAGLDTDEDGRSVVSFDMDADGDLDLVTMGLTGLRVLQNQTPPGHWLALDLVPAEGSSVGTRVRVKTDSNARTQVAKVQPTAGFHAQVSNRIHFGLGTARDAQVDVQWNSGRVERFDGLSKSVRIVENQGVQTVHRRAWNTELVVRADPFINQRLPTFDGQTESILAHDGRMTIVNLWAPSCQACVDEMPMLNALAQSETDRLRVVGVSMAEDPAEIQQPFVQKLGIQYPLMTASDRTLKSLQAHRGVPLPSTYVYDADQTLIRVFRHRVGESALRAFLAQDKPFAEDHRATAISALARGHGGKAITHLVQAIALEPDNASAHWRLGNTLLRAGQFDRALPALEEATRLAPDDPEAWVDLADVLRKLGRDKARLRALQMAVRSPQGVRGHNRLGLYWLEQKQYNVAIPFLEEATQRDPSYAPALTNLARAQRALQRFEAAEDTEARLKRLKRPRAP